MIKVKKIMAGSKSKEISKGRYTEVHLDIGQAVNEFIKTNELSDEDIVYLNFFNEGIGYRDGEYCNQVIAILTYKEKEIK